MLRSLAIYGEDILISGDILPISSRKCEKLLRITSNGERIEEFRSDVLHSRSIVNAITSQDNGKILLGGALNTTKTQSHSELIQLDESGKRDGDFDLAPPDGQISTIVVQQDRKILLGGSFSRINNNDHNSLVRLRENGTLDLGGLKQGWTMAA